MKLCVMKCSQSNDVKLDSSSFSISSIIKQHIFPVVITRFLLDVEDSFNFIKIYQYVFCLSNNVSLTNVNRAIDKYIKTIVVFLYL